MSDLVLADYSSSLPVEFPKGAEVPRIPGRKETFSISKIMLLKLDTDPRQPPYFNFTDTNKIWQFVNSRSYDAFLDLWMACGISEKSKDLSIWVDKRIFRVFCPGTIARLNGGKAWVMPVLTREENGTIWTPEFVSNGQSLSEHDRETSAIGYLIPNKFI